MGGWWLTHLQENKDSLIRIADVGYQLQHGFSMMWDAYQANKTAIAEHVLNHNTIRDVNIVVLL